MVNKIINLFIVEPEIKSTTLNPGIRDSEVEIIFTFIYLNGFLCSCILIIVLIYSCSCVKN